MSSLISLRSSIDQMKGKRELLRKWEQELSQDITQLKRKAVNADQARAIIRTVAKQTQEQLIYHLTEIADLAMEAVFDDPYKLIIEFTDERRGKTECDIWFERGGLRIDPFQASGGGPIDVASFALLIAVWAIKVPAVRPTLILDEPFKNLSESNGLQERASEMLRELSQRLGLQILMVTHSETLVESADEVFTVALRNDVSSVTFQTNKE